LRLTGTRDYFVHRSAVKVPVLTAGERVSFGRVATPAQQHRNLFSSASSLGKLRVS